MSVPAQAGVVGLTVQNAKIGDGGSFTPASYDWIRFKAPRVTFGPIQGDQVFVPEVGGTIVPTGAYKDSLYVGGQADVIPRLERSFPLMLLAVMGNASSVTGKDADGTSVSGVNTHVINFSTVSDYDIPWLGVRVQIPGRTAGDVYGITGYDCKVSSLRLTIPAMGKIAARVTMVGRNVLQEEAPSFTWDNTYEDHQSAPDVGNGYVKIGGTEYPITGMVVDFNNSLTTPQQEMVVGSFNPDDFVPLFRSMTIRFVYKWADPDLYQRIYNGSTSATDWNPNPLKIDTSGATFAFEANFLSPGMITGSTPYALRIRANRVVLQDTGPIELVAGSILQKEFVLTVLEPASGNYAQFLVTNGRTTVD